MYFGVCYCMWHMIGKQTDDLSIAEMLCLITDFEVWCIRYPHWRLSAPLRKSSFIVDELLTSISLSLSFYSWLSTRDPSDEILPFWAILRDGVAVVNRLSSHQSIYLHFWKVEKCSNTTQLTSLGLLCWAGLNCDHNYLVSRYFV